MSSCRREHRVVSPHLKQLDTPAVFDDGVIVGNGHLAGRPVLIAAQEGEFMGGAVGEVHRRQTDRTARPRNRRAPRRRAFDR